MKKESVVSILLFLVLLSFVNLFMFTSTVKAEPRIIGSTDVFGHSYQRYTFYTSGRFWVFYSDGENMGYKTSTDGLTWTRAKTVRAANYCPEFSAWFDGTYVHYAKGGESYLFNAPLYYRMGVPNANGTITWNAPEQIVVPAVENRSTWAPQIITDSEGYPVITYLNKTISGSYSLSVCKSSTKNGTWTHAAGFPMIVTNERGWPFSVPLTNGKLYTMWSKDQGKMRGSLYDGTEWMSEEDCSANFVGEDQWGACAVAYGDDVHLVYIENATATKIYRHVKRTYGGSWGSETVVKNVTGAMGDQASIGLTLDPDNGDLWMWFNTTDNNIAFRKYLTSTGIWDANDTYPFGDSFTSPYYITTSYQVRNNKILAYWQEGTAPPYDLVFDCLTVDIVPPIITVLQPQNKIYATKDVPLDITINEATPWIGYTLDGQVNVTIAGNTTLTGLSDGSHSLTIYANDTAGNMGASSTISFIVDTVSPSVVILSPENKIYATVTISLKFNVDEAASWIGYSLNGQPNVTITGNTTLTSLLDGLHYVVVYSRDTAGNTGTSNTVTFTIDTLSPTITVLQPQNKIYATKDVPLDITINEATPWIGYTLDAQPNITISGGTTIIGLAEGTHTITVYAKDTAGNTGTSNTVTFTIDTTPPNIEDVSQTPLEDKVSSEDEVVVNAIVTDELSGVKQVSLSYTNGNGAWVTVDMAHLEGNVWSAAIPAFPNSNNLTYRIIAEDIMNNTITTEDLGYEYQVVPGFSSLIFLPIPIFIALYLLVIVYKWKRK